MQISLLTFIFFIFCSIPAFSASHGIGHVCVLVGMEGIERRPPALKGGRIEYKCGMHHGPLAISHPNVLP